tara:strand:+ start:1522 stop:1803 length:282 start_codon:yes stop_codon:yes gene_type:complete
MYFIDSKLTPSKFEDDYGYFCDPSNDDCNKTSVTINQPKPPNKKWCISHNYKNSNPDIAFNEKVDKYKNALIYSTIIIGTFVITNLLVAYNII